MRWTVYRLNGHGRMAVLFNEKHRRFGCIRGWNSNHRSDNNFYNPDWEFFEEANSRCHMRKLSHLSDLDSADVDALLEEKNMMNPKKRREELQRLEEKNKDV